jgi:hypothetical protein
MIKRVPDPYLNLKTGDEYVFLKDELILDKNKCPIGPGDHFKQLFDSTHGYFVFEIIAQYGMTYQCIFLGISQGDGFGIEPIGAEGIPTIQHRYGHLPRCGDNNENHARVK